MYANFNDNLDDLEERLHARLIDEAIIDPEWTSDMRDHVLETAIESIMTDEGLVLSRADRTKLVRRLIDRVAGLGPIEKYMREEGVTEIMVNGPSSVWVQREGDHEPRRVSDTFRDENHVRYIIERIVGQVGRRIDDSSPMVDARLPDGSRVHAAVPPVSVNGPVITIRRFSRERFKLETLVRRGTLHPAIAEFLRQGVLGKLSLLVSGGTNAGKTTTLNAISSCIPTIERIVTIEDTAELQLSQPNLVSLETRPPNIEGKGEITIRELVRNALRMRPDRIIVGEVRGAEALDMLQAMNTGHPGSLSTIHANSVQDAMSRLENLVLMANSGLPITAVRDQIRGALRLVVQQGLFPDGKRRIVSIGEVVRMGGGVHDPHQSVEVRPIYQFERIPTADQNVVEGRWVCLGAPECLAELRERNIVPHPSLFQRGPLA